MFRNILFTVSLFNGLLTDLFASENSKQSSLSACWLLCLEMRGDKQLGKMQGLQLADFHAETVKYSFELFYMRRTSLCYVRLSP